MSRLRELKLETTCHLGSRQLSANAPKLTRLTCESVRREIQEIQTPLASLRGPVDVGQMTGTKGRHGPHSSENPRILVVWQSNT